MAREAHRQPLMTCYMVKITTGINIIVSRVEFHSTESRLYRCQRTVTAVARLDLLPYELDSMRRLHTFLPLARDSSYLHLLPGDVFGLLLKYSPFHDALAFEIQCMFSKDVSLYSVTASFANAYGGVIPTFTRRDTGNGNMYALWTTNVKGRDDVATLKRIVKKARKNIEDIDTDEGWARMKRNKTVL